jgi:Flp pilus assembly protein TadG
MLIRQARQARSGAVVVETAVIMLVFMLLFLGLMEYCRLLWVREMLQNAVRDGARYAVVHQGDKVTSDVQDQVWRAMGGNTSTGSNPVGRQLANHSNAANPFTKTLDSTSDILVYRSNASGVPENINLSTGATTTYSSANWTSADWRNARFGDYIAVQIVCNYKPLSGKLLFMPTTISMTFTSIMSSEANQ